MTTEMKQVLAIVREMKSELHDIHARVIDPDTILTCDDLDSIRRAKEDLRAGKTRRLS